ncbi:hypothetical protein A7982_13775 [Minicystis rosea]|nr:hypothetical protein A7982_13775 [Minicystis rosea]
MILRLRPALNSIFFVAWLAAAGLVVGFCLGGLLGNRLFGSLGGHGLGDLGYLFGGALLGMVGGMAVGVHGVMAWPPRRQLQVAGWAALGAAVLAGVTAVVVNAFGGW